MILFISWSLQTAAEYEAQYWSQVNSPHNEEINLTDIVKPNSTIFAYAQHCHEATVTLALGLHNTNEGRCVYVCVCMWSCEWVIDTIHARGVTCRSHACVSWLTIQKLVMDDLLDNLEIFGLTNSRWHRAFNGTINHIRVIDTLTVQDSASSNMNHVDTKHASHDWHAATCIHHHT